MRYRADITAGSLKVSESRVIADLLLQEAKPEDFQQALMRDNVLQKKNPVSARRQARLIRNRLEPMSRDIWLFVCDGSLDQAVHALFCAAIRQNRLLGDFLLTVVQEHHRTFKKSISSQDYHQFFQRCIQIKPDLAELSPSTIEKIRQVVFRILAEAGIVESSRSLRLRPFLLLPEIRACMFATNEEYVLKCLEGLP